MNYQETLSTPQKEVTRRPNSIYTLVGNPHPTSLHVLKVLGEEDRVGCFENDLYPGNVPERPFESGLAGCIPIWRGIDRGNFLNPEAIFDFTSHVTSDLLNIIDEIDECPEKAAKMQKIQILQRNFELRLLQEQILDDATL